MYQLVCAYCLLTCLPMQYMYSHTTCLVTKAKNFWSACDQLKLCISSMFNLWIHRRQNRGGALGAISPTKFWLPIGIIFFTIQICIARLLCSTLLSKFSRHCMDKYLSGNRPNHWKCFSPFSLLYNWFQCVSINLPFPSSSLPSHPSLTFIDSVSS